VIYNINKLKIHYMFLNSTIIKSAIIFLCFTNYIIVERIIVLSSWNFKFNCYTYFSKRDSRILSALTDPDSWICVILCHFIENRDICIDDLPGGMYFIELITKDNRRWSKPFIKMEYDCKQ